MPELCSPSQCTGCAACMNTCPVRAISMDDASGHYKPRVDESLCLHCGKCEKVCPALNYSSTNKAEDVRSYALSASDEERRQSSTGAIFPLVARHILNQGGYVCGAAWDAEWNVHHIIIDSVDELPKLRFSKYVQSYVGRVFVDIKQLLKEGKRVLFSGVPCQVAGLLRFLGKKDDNLLTIDILCHGAPSPRVWKDYLRSHYDVGRITDVCFRSKEDGWRLTRYGCYDTKGSYILADGKKTPIGDYYRAFLNHALSNEACRTCPFKFVPRPGDITLGDFWWYTAYDEALNDGKGLAVALANSPAGQEMLQRVQAECKLFREIDLQQRWQHLEIEAQLPERPQRDLFFRDYTEGLGVKKALAAAAQRHYDVALVGMFNGCNYGSALVAYAAQEIIRSLGYSVVMLHKKRYETLPMGESNRSLAFARTHCHMTRLYDCAEDVSEVNALADTFVVGSDTNWWWGDVEQVPHFYWLDFVHAGKRKISFSTSFAHPTPDIPAEEYPKLRYLYSRFDRLSVREESGVKNLRELFHVEGTHLIDPTLVAQPEIFEQLAAESTRTDKGYVFAYILDVTPEKERAAQYIAQQLGLSLKIVPSMVFEGNHPLIDENYIDIVDFVYFIRNADFVVTDSFHGTVFSTIFHRPFVSLVNAWRGMARYDLFFKMGLGSRILSDTENVYRDFALLREFPDFSAADALVQQEREKALAWLAEALACKPGEVTSADLLYDYLYATRAQAAAAQAKSSEPRPKKPRGLKRVVKNIRRETRKGCDRLLRGIKRLFSRG